MLFFSPEKISFFTFSDDDDESCVCMNVVMKIDWICWIILAETDIPEIKPEIRFSSMYVCIINS